MYGLKAAVVCLVLLAGLGVQAKGQKKPMTEKPWSLSGGFGAIRTPRQVVVRDAKAFAALWKELYSAGEPPPVPAVDFAKSHVVGVWWGSKNTGGYRVEIGDLVVKGKEATINVVLWNPPKGAMLTQAFTNPFAMMAVPKLPEKVTFKTTEKVAELK